MKTFCGRMTQGRTASGVVFVAAMFLFCTQPTTAQEQAHWVTTWATAQQLVRPMPPQRPAAGAGEARPGAPAAQAPPARAGGAPRGPAPVPDLTGKTVRMIVHTSIGGSRVRITLAD